MIPQPDSWNLCIIWVSSWHCIWLWIANLLGQPWKIDYDWLNLFIGLLITLVHCLFGLNSRTDIVVHLRFIFKIHDSCSKFKVKFYSKNSSARFNISSLDFGKKALLLEEQVTFIQRAIFILTYPITSQKIHITSNYNYTPKY